MLPILTISTPTLPQRHKYRLAALVVQSPASLRSNFQGRIRRKSGSRNALRHRGGCAHKCSIIEAFFLFDRAIEERAESRGLGENHLVSLLFDQSI